MKCLDTYALAEIAQGNKNYTNYLQEDFVITGETLAEFIWVLLRDQGKEVADMWDKKLQTYAVSVPVDILVKAMKFRHTHRKQKISFFDSVGYIFAEDRGFLFVTGDKEFEHMKNVEFVK